MNSPMVVSFYTLGTPYEDHADRLRRSLVKFGVEHDIHGIRMPGASWVKACAVKAAFCLGRYAKHKVLSTRRPMVWLDADAEVCGPLEDMAPAGTDFAAHRPDRKRHPLLNCSLMSGTLYFGSSYATLNLLTRWVDRLAIKTREWDQDALAAALDATPDHFNLKFVNLDPRYVAIDLMPDVWEGRCGKVVVRHHQASRTLKDRIDSDAQEQTPC